MTCFAKQCVQQVEFNRGKLDRLAILANAASGWIKFHVAEADWLCRLQCSFPFTSTAQNRADARNQLTRIGALGQIIVSPAFKTDNTIAIFAARTEKANWDTGFTASAREDTEAVHARRT